MFCLCLSSAEFPTHLFAKPELPYSVNAEED